MGDNKTLYVGIPASSYVEKKGLGLVHLMKIGAQYVEVVEKFNSETGQAADPETYSISINDLNAKKEVIQGQIGVLQAEIGDIDVLMADLQAL